MKIEILETGCPKCKMLEANAQKALSKLVFECKVDKTPVIIEKIVSDIDDVVKVTRFDG